MTQLELNKILKNHKHWLDEDCDGWETMRASFKYANLTGANLTGANLGYCKFDCSCTEKCENFQDRSLWVKLPSEDYAFTICGDLARGIIIANCRAAEERERALKVCERNEK